MFYRPVVEKVYKCLYNACAFRHTRKMSLMFATVLVKITICRNILVEVHRIQALYKIWNIRSREFVLSIVLLVNVVLLLNGVVLLLSVVM
jgi:hypothetical protein